MNSFEVKLIGLLILVAIFLSHDQNKTMMAAAQDCLEDVEGIAVCCLVFIGKDSSMPAIPNHRCCNVIQAANIPCFCSHFPQQISTKYPTPKPVHFEDMLDWNRVMKVFNTCGRPFAPGTKCGHFVAPPVYELPSN